MHKLHKANGTFEVKLTPQSAEESVGDPSISRLGIKKHFQGGLEASSSGQMLALHAGTEGSAAYVAIERVSGVLDGRSGTFALQHNGSMTRGTPQLTVIVVPDSGTGELAGLVGFMAINIVEGQHLYDFEYTLTHAGTPEAAAE